MSPTRHSKRASRRASTGDAAVFQVTRTRTVQPPVIRSEALASLTAPSRNRPTRLDAAAADGPSVTQRAAIRTAGSAARTARRQADADAIAVAARARAAARLAEREQSEMRPGVRIAAV